MICIYHNKDLDGYCSGAIVKLKYPDCKMIGYDYGQPLEIEATGEEIIMVDVSVPMTTMMKLAQMANYKFTWIDHHISAINDYNKFLSEFLKGDIEQIPPFTAILENGISACEGAWKYLFPDKQMPTAVKLLGEYDTWRNQDKHRWDNAILPFQFGMRQFCNSAETFPTDLFEDYDNVTDSPVYSIIGKGKTILDYQATQNERACASSAFEFTFGDMKAICLNGGGFNSDVFKSVYDESKHVLMMPFVFSKDHWTISLYTTKEDIDCSVLAKQFGGGGHRKAAGFQVKDIREIIPFV